MADNLKVILPKYIKFPKKAYSYRIEYGEGKVLVAHVSRRSNEMFSKCREEIFEISNLEKYGFSYEICGRVVEWQVHSRRGNRIEYIPGDTIEGSKEVVFCLKDGTKVVFASINFAKGQLHELVEYIAKETGIMPTGSLASDLVQAEFINEPVDIVYDMVKVPKARMESPVLSFEKINLMFMEKELIFYENTRVIAIPYEKLRGIFYSRLVYGGKGACFIMNFLNFVLSNGEVYKCECKLNENIWREICTFVNENYPKLEADRKMIYEYKKS